MHIIRRLTCLSLRVCPASSGRQAMSVYRFLTLCGTVGLLLTFCSAKTAAQQPALQKPTPLPEAIEKAWAAAGAEIGWMRMLHMGEQMPDIYTLTFVPRDVAQSGDIPAFRLRALEAGLLAKLPEPQVPFGLDLTKLPLTDRWLVDLRGLKNVQALNLAGRHITDTGLKELAVLENLKWLNLDFTQVTDAGLKELAALKNLQTLNLAVTRVTDAGLKELAGLKNLQWIDLFRTQLTDTGIAELKKAPPYCAIVR
jgi:internalin A